MAATLRSEYVDRILTNLSQEWRNSTMLGDIIAPKVPVSKLSGIYYEHRKTAFKTRNLLISNSGIIPETDFGFTEKTYTISYYGNAVFVSDVAKMVQDEPIQMEYTAMERIQEEMVLAKEIRVRDELVNNCPSSGAFALADQWDGLSANSTANPIRDIENANIQVMLGTAGLPATHLIMSYPVANKLSRQPYILELQKYTHPDLINEFGLPKTIRGLNVLVGSAQYITSMSTDPMTQDPQTVVTDYVWGKDAFVIRLNDKPGLRTINSMITFQFQDYVVEKYRVPERRGDRIQITHGVQEKLVTTGAAYRLQGVIA